MVYLAKKRNEVVHHTSKEAMLEMDGIAKADMEISDEEFEKAGCLARIIGGKIVIGKTEDEKKIEENAERILFLKNCLAETDYIAAKIAEGEATAEDYADKIAEGEATAEDYADKIAQRKAWRKEISELESA